MFTKQRKQDSCERVYEDLDPSTLSVRSQKRMHHLLISSRTLKSRFLKPGDDDDGKVEKIRVSDQWSSSIPWKKRKWTGATAESSTFTETDPDTRSACTVFYLNQMTQMPRPISWISEAKKRNPWCDWAYLANRTIICPRSYLNIALSNHNTLLNIFSMRQLHIITWLRRFPNPPTSFYNLSVKRLEFMLSA